MLSTIYIENTAVIEKAEISFSDGFNVLTGETGAGKSIIIDAINMILGQRTSKELIRTGSSAAFVSAAFENVSEQACSAALELGFPAEDGVLILQRELHANGKNVCRINSRPATVSALRRIGSLLITIHGQHESYELLSADSHVDYLDVAAKDADLLSEYKKKYARLCELKRELDSFQSDDALRMQQIDLLSYQIDELTKANLSEDEYEELVEEKTVLENAEKITGAVMYACENLNGSDDSEGALELLESAADSVSTAAESCAALRPLASKLLDMYYEIKDCSYELETAGTTVESNPERLEEVEERLDLIYRLSRKYGATVADMLEFLENAENRLAQLEQYDINYSSVQSEYEKAKNEVISLAEKLSSERRAAAVSFANDVKKELAFLDMPNAEFIVEITKTSLNEKGADRVEFLISANKGETPKPAAKIASGGELSRIMLALKNVLADCEPVSTMIFDEVDTGISGSAALKVGLKLKQLSEARQVMCITHQAQIASLADSHYFIQKHTQGERTYTTVRTLDFEERKTELAHIIGGREITAAALAHAEELLLQGAKKQ